MKPHRLTVTATLLFLTSLSPAMAEGCPPKYGITIPEIEVMNQHIVDSEFDALAYRIKGHIGKDLGSDLAPVAELFEDGFTGCTTIAQRVEIGGMVQSIVIYHGKIGPLFGYWLTYKDDTGAKLITFQVNTDIEEVMGRIQ